MGRQRKRRITREILVARKRLKDAAVYRNLERVALVGTVKRSATNSDTEASLNKPAFDNLKRLGCIRSWKDGRATYGKLTKFGEYELQRLRAVSR